MNEMRRAGAGLKTGEHRDVREQVHQQRKLSPTASRGSMRPRAGGSGVSGMPENLDQGAYLRVVRFFDGCHGDNALGRTLVTGHTTWFTNGNDGARSMTAPP